MSIELRIKRVVAAVAISAVVLLAVVLRLADPLSSSVIPAEDPYNHMAHVREHIRSGEISPLNDVGNVYPPGLHAFLAAAWVFTGIDLYSLILFGPVLFGAIGVLGIGILLWRTAGPVAGFVAALAIAVGAEAIFRTTMMSPTALDLAILPFFLYALLRLLSGRLGWAGVAAPMALFLAFAHPWLLGILCLAGIVFVVLTILLPASGPRSEPVALSGIGACIAILGISAGIAFTTPSFGGAIGFPSGVNVGLVGLGIAAASAGIAVIIGFRVRRKKVSPNVARTTPSLVLRALASAAIATIVGGVWLLATSRGMPEFVDLPRMFGWPVLLLAFAALVALPWIASPIANMGGGLFAATFPFVVFNPMDSEFLPHRTAIFLGLGLAILAGVIAGAAARAASDVLHKRAAAGKVAGTGRRGALSRPLMLASPVLLVGLLLGGAVYAGTPDGYPGGWYRLYNECELDGLRDIARQADESPDAIILVGAWETKLVLAGLTTDAKRVWFMHDFFTSETRRDDLVATMANNGRPIIVVIDRHLLVQTSAADMHFVDSAPWAPSGSWCSGQGFAQPRMAAYVTGMASP